MVFWYLLFLLAVLGLLAALIVSACRWSGEVTVLHFKETKLQSQTKQLQEQNKQLNKELNEKLQRDKQAAQAKVQAVQSSVQSSGSLSVQRVRSSGSCEQYRPLFAQYPWNVEVALAVCNAESGGNPNAISRTDDHGLMQIHQGVEIYGSQIYDPAFNVSIAYNNKYLASGWYPWSTCTNGTVKCW